MSVARLSHEQRHAASVGLGSAIWATSEGSTGAPQPCSTSGSIAARSWGFRWHLGQRNLTDFVDAQVARPCDFAFRALRSVDDNVKPLPIDPQNTACAQAVLHRRQLPIRVLSPRVSTSICASAIVGSPRLRWLHSTRPLACCLSSQVRNRSRWASPTILRVRSIARPMSAAVTLTSRPSSSSDSAARRYFRSTRPRLCVIGWRF